jgi:hypothetical protein
MFQEVQKNKSYRTIIVLHYKNKTNNILMSNRATTIEKQQKQKKIKKININYSNNNNSLHRIMKYHLHHQ